MCADGRARVHGCAPVAQRIEQPPPKRKVAGSTPAWGTPRQFFRRRRPTVLPEPAADHHPGREQRADDGVDDVVLRGVHQHQRHRQRVEQHQPPPRRAQPRDGEEGQQERESRVQGRHRGGLVGHPEEHHRLAVQVDLGPAAAAHPVDLPQVAVAGGHPRRRHRVGPEQHQRDDVQGDEAAHPQHPLGPVADPEHAGDGQPDQEVGGVDGGEEDVVPAGRHGLEARVAAPRGLQPLGRGHPAAQPLVEADRHRVVHRRADLVRQAAQQPVDDEDQQRPPPVAPEVEVLAPSARRCSTRWCRTTPTAPRRRCRSGRRSPGSTATSSAANPAIAAARARGRVRVRGRSTPRPAVTGAPSLT